MIQGDFIILSAAVSLAIEIIQKVVLVGCCDNWHGCQDKQNHNSDIVIPSCCLY